eukprot:CAMPEP_0177561362 /NCGR_PEP_ID=MMETSP0369-20130122/71890_1 /TAXON_ID=447022 ORGANISM="Scrippsiella hangoei-like, Strain SHHI-4" /NCGR_SAMPLE_ID=MMETSP0369 /ASSEMBLY_ACC=CAM_ASM_000364 /LENGTH=50 /DNA_ID=CAMNT_0019048275 /DNA_START=6 /DNA_END=156 /DNA_ORIENTATION=-
MIKSAGLIAKSLCANIASSSTTCPSKPAGTAWTAGAAWQQLLAYAGAAAA